MSTLVLTVIGDERAGFVETLAEVITAHGGNWEQSRMAELAGQFAGIVVVTVPSERADELRAALDGLEGLEGLEGLMDVTAHPGVEEPAPPETWSHLSIDLIGSDHPGIVRDVSAALARHGLSIESMATERRDAPMSGGRLFEAHLLVRVPPDVDPADVRDDLDRTAGELFVDLTVGEA